MRRAALDPGADGDTVLALTRGLLVEAKQRAHHAFGLGAGEVAFPLPVISGGAILRLCWLSSCLWETSVQAGQ